MIELLEFFKSVGIFIKIISVIKSLFYRIRWGAPMKLYLRKFEESVSQNNISFEIESTVENSLSDHIFLSYFFGGNKFFTKLPITPKDKSLQPYKTKSFSVDCSSIANFPSLLFRRYEIKSVRGPIKTLYFRRASNLIGSKMSAIRYCFEVHRYRLFGKLKDKYTSTT